MNVFGVRFRSNLGMKWFDFRKLNSAQGKGVCLGVGVGVGGQKNWNPYIVSPTAPSTIKFDIGDL